MTLPENWQILLLCGAIGGFSKDIFKDDKIKLPYFKGGFLYLGCLTGMILGAIAGYVVDNDPMTAFLGGFSGVQIIGSLVKNQTKEV